MGDFQSPGQLSREGMPDAPDGDWLDAILQNYNQTQRQLLSNIKRGLTTKQNTTSDEKQLNLVHNVEIACANPLDVDVVGIWACACVGLTLDSTGAPIPGAVYALDTPIISWRPNPLSKNGGVLVKATYQPSVVAGAYVPPDATTTGRVNLYFYGG